MARPMHIVHYGAPHICRTNLSVTHVVHHCPTASCTKAGDSISRARTPCATYQGMTVPAGVWAKRDTNMPDMKTNTKFQDVTVVLTSPPLMTPLLRSFPFSGVAAFCNPTSSMTLSTLS